MKRNFLLALAVGVLLGGGVAFPQNLGTVRILLPGDVGSGFDAGGRALGDSLVEAGYAKAVVYENFPGASGGQATARFVKLPYYEGWLLLQSSPIILRNLNGMYLNRYTDLVPVAALSAEVQVVSVLADSPLRTLKDALDLMKENPVKFPFICGSAQGSDSHVCALLLLRAAGVQDLASIRFSFNEGDGPGVDVLKTSKTILLSGYGSSMKALVKAGTLRILAISSENGADGIPSFAESGYKVDFSNWRGVFLRKGTSADVQKSYIAALTKLYSTGVWKDQLQKNGWVPFFKAGPQFEAYLENQEAIFRPIVDGLKP